LADKKVIGTYRLVRRNCAHGYMTNTDVVWYDPGAEVGHKVFDYRTRPKWLLRRAFWQGYSKRAMEVLVPESNTEESAYLADLLIRYMPARSWNAIREPSTTEATKLLMLFVFTSCVGLGYLYAFTRWR
jgi:hypothetical protein